MMKPTILLTLVLFFLTTVLTAQRQETLFGDRGLHFSGIWGAATYSYNFFDADQAYQPGGNIGLEFGRTLFLGYAWSRFRNDIALPQGNTAFSLKQRSFLLSIAPASYQVLHPVLSVQTGGGRVTLSDGTSDRVFILQPSAGVEVNVFKWFHLGAEGGYRFVSENDLPGISREDLSSFYAQINLRFGVSWGR